METAIFIFMGAIGILLAILVLIAKVTMDLLISTNRSVNLVNENLGRIYRYLSTINISIIRK